MRRIATCVLATAAATLLAAVPAFAADPYEASDPAAAEADAPDDDPADNPIPGEMPRAEGMAQPAGQAEYVVEKGDTLASIAQEKLGSPDKWKVIAQANGVEDPSKLRVGQRLVIPNDRAADKPMRSQF